MQTEPKADEKREASQGKSPDAAKTDAAKSVATDKSEGGKAAHSAQQDSGPKSDARRSDNNSPRRGKKGGRQRRPMSGRRRADERPPRFEPAELFELAGMKAESNVVQAKVADVTGAAIFFEASIDGTPTRLAVDPQEFAMVGAPEEGAEHALLVGTAKPEDGATSASAHQAAQLAALDAVKVALEEKTPVTGYVAAEVKGGYAVALFSSEPGEPDGPGVVRAFLPRRHGFHPRLHAVKDPVGEVDEFDVNEFEPERANIVLTRKRRLERRYKDLVKNAWTDLEVGATVKGVVRSIVAYGAFIDVGGVDGLLHVSDLAWTRPPHISSVLKEGQVIETQVLVANKKTGKLKLGLKQLIPNPWQDMRGNVVVGADIEGDVVALTDYGAFIRVMDGVEGLVHMSEVTWDRIKHVSQKLTIGQHITARVLDVNYDEQRLSLSMRALEGNPYAKVAETYPAGTVIRVQVKSLTDFGAFVQLDDNVDGLVHIGEISWTERLDHPSEALSIGDEVEAVVLNVDVDRHRVSCSIKQLQENPWKGLEKKYAPQTRHTLTVTKVIDAGAYFGVDEPLSAFCSKRDISDEPIMRAQDVVRVGQEIEVLIKSLDRRARKLSVSARAIIEGDTRAAYDEYRKSEGGEARLTLADQIGHIQLGDAPADDKAEDNPRAEAAAPKMAPSVDGALMNEAAKKVDAEVEPVSPVEGALMNEVAKKVDAEDEPASPVEGALMNEVAKKVDAEDDA